MRAPALVDRVRERLASAGGEISAAVVAAAVRAEAGGVVSDVDVLSALRMLQQEFTGAGPLEPLLRDPGTTDVLVTAPDSVWVDRGDGLIRTEVRFTDEASVRRLAQRLALAAGRRLDDASPYVDAAGKRRASACGARPDRGGRHLSVPAHAAPGGPRSGHSAPPRHRG